MPQQTTTILLAGHDFMNIRPITKNDFDHIISVLDAWWGGPSGERLHPAFFHELGKHALIAEKPAEEQTQLIGFLFGFMNQSHQTGYIHLVGIHPDHRKKSVGKALYTNFIEQCKNQKIYTIKAITHVGNETSIGFHKAMGFSVTEERDYAGKGRPRIVFLKSF